jgi:hypothetical protein
VSLNESVQLESQWPLVEVKKKDEMREGEEREEKQISMVSSSTKHFGAPLYKTAQKPKY